MMIELYKSFLTKLSDSLTRLKEIVDDNMANCETEVIMFGILLFYFFSMSFCIIIVYT